VSPWPAAARRLVQPSTIRTSVVASLAVFGSAALGNLLSVYAFDPIDRGRLAIVATAAVMAYLTASNGPAHAHTFAVASGYVPPRAALRAIAPESTVVVIAAAVVLAGALMVALATDASPWELAGWTVFAGVASYSTLLLGVILGAGRFRYFSNARVIVNSLMPCIILTGLVVGRLTVGGVGWALAAGTLVFALVVRRSVTDLDPHAPDSPRTFLRREWWGYALRGSGSTLAGSANARVDVLVAGAVLSESEVGVYVAATAIAVSLRIIGDGVSHYIFPKAATTPDVRTLTTRCSVGVAVAGGLACVALMVARPVVVAVLPDAYESAGDVLVFAAIGYAVAGVSLVIAASLRGRGFPGSSGLADALGAVVTVGVAVALQHRGAVGMAIGATAGNLAGAGLLLFRFRKITTRVAT
jgi:O-antigen/teichoic acid export membrane protein